MERISWTPTSSKCNSGSSAAQDPQEKSELQGTNPCFCRKLFRTRPPVIWVTSTHSVQAWLLVSRQASLGRDLFWIQIRETILLAGSQIIALLAHSWTGTTWILKVFKVITTDLAQLPIRHIQTGLRPKLILEWVEINRQERTCLSPRQTAIRQIRICQDRWHPAKFLREGQSEILCTPRLTWIHMTQGPCTLKSKIQCKIQWSEFRKLDTRPYQTRKWGRCHMIDRWTKMWWGLIRLKTSTSSSILQNRGTFFFGNSNKMLNLTKIIIKRSRKSRNTKAMTCLKRLRNPKTAYWHSCPNQVKILTVLAPMSLSLHLLWSLSRATRHLLTQQTDNRAKTQHKVGRTSQTSKTSTNSSTSTINLAQSRLRTFSKLFRKPCRCIRRSSNHRNKSFQDQSQHHWETTWWLLMRGNNPRLLTQAWRTLRKW